MMIYPDFIESPQKNIKLEHYWWDGFWDYPYVVTLTAHSLEYYRSFRTKFMARRYMKKVIKRIYS